MAEWILYYNKGKEIMKYLIKECSFCKGKGMLVSKHCGDQSHSHLHYVVCLKCNNQSKEYLDYDINCKEKAVTNWNNRHN